MNAQQKTENMPVSQRLTWDSLKKYFMVGKCGFLAQTSPKDFIKFSYYIIIASHF